MSQEQEVIGDCSTSTGAFVPDGIEPTSGLDQRLQSPIAWVRPRSIADMPKKPGKERYEYVECLVIHRGDVLCRPWNCEHEVFDDEAHDDFFCEWSDVSAYADLTGAIGAAQAIEARSDETACGLGPKGESAVA